MRTKICLTSIFLLIGIKTHAQKSQFGLVYTQATVLQKKKSFYGYNPKENWSLGIEHQLKFSKANQGHIELGYGFQQFHNSSKDPLTDSTILKINHQSLMFSNGFSTSRKFSKRLTLIGCADFFGNGPHRTVNKYQTKTTINERSRKLYGMRLGLGTSLGLSYNFGSGMAFKCQYGIRQFINPGMSITSQLREERYQFLRLCMLYVIGSKT